MASNVVSQVKSTLLSKEIVFSSVSHRYEAMFVNGPKGEAANDEALAAFGQAVQDALNGLGEASQVSPWYDKTNKLNCVSVLNFKLHEGAPQATQAPQAPAPATASMKEAFTRDQKKRGKKAQAPAKNELVDEMAVDEGLAGDGEIEDIEAPRADLENL